MTRRERLPPAVVLGAVTASIYAALVLGVGYLDHASETAKHARGTYTDAFSPLLFAQLVSLPGSAFGESPGYPPGPFDETAHPAVASEILRTCLVATALQALVIGVFVASIAAPPTDGSARQRRLGL